MKKVYFFIISVFILSFSANAQVVINEVYGGGGNTGATYKNDFIELFNSGSAAVNLAGWSVQYASAAGTSWSVTILTGSIAPGSFYLIQEAVGAGGTTSLPTPDATGSIALSATAGKVALVNNSTALSGAAPTGANIIDLVGFSSTASAYETLPAPAPSNTTSIARSPTGNDTNNNSTDFVSGTPTPQNSSTALPIKLSLFQVQKIDNTFKINWITEQEIDTKNFIVEKSADGNIWNTIATLPAAGNSSIKNNYSYIDNNIMYGINYYRLLQTNKDGSYEYSAVQKGFFSKTYKIQIVPNPATDFINIYLDKNTNQLAVVQLLNVDGKAIYSTTSTQQIIKVDARNLSKGIYFVKIIDNENTTTTKILVQ